MMGGRSLRGVGNSAESTLGRKPAIFLRIRAARPPATRGRQLGWSNRASERSRGSAKTWMRRGRLPFPTPSRGPSLESCLGSPVY